MKDSASTGPDLEGSMVGLYLIVSFRFHIVRHASAASKVRLFEHYVRVGRDGTGDPHG